MSKYFSVWWKKTKKNTGMTHHKMNRRQKGRLKVEVIREGLTKQVDDAFIIGSKEPDGVFEEEHEGRIDDSISQLVGIDLR